MKLIVYGGSNIPNLGSCQVYIKGPNNPNPKVIQAEVVDVDGPAIIGNMSAQNLDHGITTYGSTQTSSRLKKTKRHFFSDIRGPRMRYINIERQLLAAC